MFFHCLEGSARCTGKVSSIIGLTWAPLLATPATLYSDLLPGFDVELRLVFVFWVGLGHEASLLGVPLYYPFT